ncbi:MAG TPA: VCBS repeat-containing protein, partial [Diaminobutyricibacter sp.]
PSATYWLGSSYTNPTVADASGVATFSIDRLGYLYAGPGEPYNWTLHSHSQLMPIATGMVFFSDHCAPLPPRRSNFHDYDISGDGFADLLSIDKKGVLRYYPNNSHSNPGHVPFMTSVVIGSGWTPMLNVSAGDVNGDGHTDIVAATPGGILKLYVDDYVHHHTSPFGTSVTIGSGWTAKGIPKFTLADFNGDGYADIIAYHPDGSAWFYQNRFPTNRAHPFSTAVRIGTSAGSLPVDLAAGDLNGDGPADLVVGPSPQAHPNLAPAGNPEPFGFVVYPFNSAGAENPAGGFALGDWEGRGYDSLISMSPDGSGNLVYIKDPMPPNSGTFYDPVVISKGWQGIARIIP